MNAVKKSKFTDRLRNAWAALVNKPVKSITIGVDVIRCSECGYYQQARECGYYQQAHEPAQTAEAAPPNHYWHEITYLDDLVLVVLYEATEDGPKELARSHGHIIHEGVEGIAQAASYAMKGVWYKVQSTK